MTTQSGSDRDLLHRRWDLGVVFARMVFGLDVCRKYPSPTDLVRGSKSMRAQKTSHLADPVFDISPPNVRSDRSQDPIGLAPNRVEEAHHGSSSVRHTARVQQQWRQRRDSYYRANDAQKSWLAAAQA